MECSFLKLAVWEVPVDLTSNMIQVKRTTGDYCFSCDSLKSRLTAWNGYSHLIASALEWPALATYSRAIVRTAEGGSSKSQSGLPS
jgi:hypothetical protein